VLAARDRVRASRPPRRDHPRQAQEPARLCVGAVPLLPAQVGGGGRLAGHAQEPRRSRPIPRRAESRAASGAGRPPALRGLSRHRAFGSRPHPRDERHHGTAHGVRHRERGLGAHRTRARACALGRGDPPPRPRADLLLLQPLSRVLGSAGGRGSARRHRLSLRRRPSGADAGGGRLGARPPAHGFLRHALLRAPLSRDREARGYGDRQGACRS
jgi:hypothetical protein